MGSSSGEEDEVELARARLTEILAKARKLEVPACEILATRPARKLLARTSGALGRCALRLGLLCLVLAGLYVYVRWPTQEVETVRTVLRRTIHYYDYANHDPISKVKVRTEFWLLLLVISFSTRVTLIIKVSFWGHSRPSGSSGTLDLLGTPGRLLVPAKDPKSLGPFPLKQCPS